MESASKVRRVVLKLSGEAFCKEGEQGIDIEEVRSIAQQIAGAVTGKCQTAVVVGGGNIVRGAELSRHGIDQATGDYMGMLSTVINAMALQDAVEKCGVVTRVLSAIPIQAVAEPWIRRRAMRHLEKGRLVILAAGTGNPHFTTDTAAALRATEIHAEALLKGSKVDGVYSADPEHNPKAKRFERLQYLEVLNKDLRVMDHTAITMCREFGIPIVVFSLKVKGNILRALRGDKVGTVIS